MTQFRRLTLTLLMVLALQLHMIGLISAKFEYNLAVKLCKYARIKPGLYAYNIDLHQTIL